MFSGWYIIWWYVSHICRFLPFLSITWGGFTGRYPPEIQNGLTIVHLHWLDFPSQNWKPSTGDFPWFYDLSPLFPRHLWLHPRVSHPELSCLPLPGSREIVGREGELLVPCWNMLGSCGKSPVRAGFHRPQASTIQDVDIEVINDLVLMVGWWLVRGSKPTRCIEDVPSMSWESHS